MPRLFHNRDLQRLLGWNRIQNGTTNTRQSFVGYSGAYRICFAFAVFHLFMALILFRTQTKQDLRNGLQNGFWFFKIVSIIGLIVTNFLWPIDEFNRSLRKENKFRWHIFEFQLFCTLACSVDFYLFLFKWFSWSIVFIQLLNIGLQNLIMDTKYIHAVRNKNWTLFSPRIVWFDFSININVCFFLCLGYCNDNCFVYRLRTCRRSDFLLCEFFSGSFLVENLYAKSDIYCCKYYLLFNNRYCFNSTSNSRI